MPQSVSLIPSNQQKRYAMAEYPFTLQGAKRRYNEAGRRDGETYKSPEFVLTSGIVIAEIEHAGEGDFQIAVRSHRRVERRRGGSSPHLAGQWLPELRQAQLSVVLFR